MKLLFDQNISFRITKKIRPIFSNSNQVRDLGLENYSDEEIWSFAKENNFAEIAEMKNKSLRKIILEFAKEYHESKVKLVVEAARNEGYDEGSFDPADDGYDEETDCTVLYHNV